MTDVLPVRRQLPRLMACMGKGSVENMRNRALFCLDVLDAKEIRRRRRALHECLILEMRESGYIDSADYLQDLIYDNMQLVEDDDIGLVVDLRTRLDYLEDISDCLMKAEREHDRDDLKKESTEFLQLGLRYANKEKGNLWLAEKFFLTAIAVASHYMLDGGRMKNVCKYYYAKFLLDKFPDADPEEAFVTLTEVRDASVGRGWLICESDSSESRKDQEEESAMTVFAGSAIQLHRVLLSKVRMLRGENAAKAERLARLAERRAIDANETDKVAEAILEIGICQLMMNSLTNAKNTFARAEKIFYKTENITGLCDTKMHTAAVHQKIRDYAEASRYLSEMGALAMEHGLRRQLGRALHLLGELHLRRERPELGTEHLKEAFSCFMGNWEPETHEEELRKQSLNDESVGVHVIYATDKGEIYEEEAEQSRFMMAVSAGQERMTSFFNLMREAGDCNVAQTKIIEWKADNFSWMVDRLHHNWVPCMCKLHNRTPLDVLKRMAADAEELNKETEDDQDEEATLEKGDKVIDMRRLRTSLYHANEAN